MTDGPVPRSRRVLFVDDEPSLLETYERQLRTEIDMRTAAGPAAGLAELDKNGPIAVVVADLDMPGMNGIQFLGQVRTASPETVPMMLTGHADEAAAMAAVNDVHVFRMLRKPCKSEELLEAVRAALHEYAQTVERRELLEKTVSGSVNLLTEIVGMIDPAAAGAAQKMRGEAGQIARALGEPDVWKVELAAQLARIGELAAPRNVIAKLSSGAALSSAERDIVDRLPETAHRLLCNIPHLEDVARIVRYQEKRYDGVGFPRDDVRGAHIPLGARILKALNDRRTLERKSPSRKKAMEELVAREGWYDPDVIEELTHPTEVSDAPEARPRRVTVHELRPGQVLLEDIANNDGTLLIGQGNIVSAALCERLRNFAKLGMVKEPIQVLATVGSADEVAA